MDGGVIKCKNCGNISDISKAVNGLIECEYCFSKITVPKKDISPAALSFLRQGEHDLDTCKFDDAYSAYAKAAEHDGGEPEAYWGMALSEFKVQYIKDTKDNRLQPICHEFIDKQFTANKNYNLALKYATPPQKEEYSRRAREIDYIRSEFLKLKQSGLSYDSFICVKVSRIDTQQSDVTKKNWTDDAYDADTIYDLLKRNGYSPFYSEREIRGRSGADYEAMILYALYTAETMLVVCRNEDYLQTPWVKNEYTRFKELVNNKEKENDSLTFVYNGRPIEKLPGSNGKIQGIDYSKREADFEIVKFVERHTPAARAKREEEKRRKQAEAELLKKKLEEQERAQREFREQQERAQREFQEKQMRELEDLKAKARGAQTGGGTATVNSLLTRARQEMSFKEYGNAKEYYNKVLDIDPQNPDGWWGLFLVEFGVEDESDLLENLDNNTVRKIFVSRNYKSAERYASGDTKKRIDSFTNAINCPKSRWKLFLDEFNVANESELIENLNDELLKQIEKNDKYNAVLKDGEGEIKQRAEKFRAAIHSGDVWWKGLLRTYGAKSGNDLLSRATNEQLFNLPQDPYYKNAYKYASGDFTAILNAFISELFSFKLWWGRFISSFNAKDEKEILMNFKKEYEKIPQSDKCFLRADKYANEEEKKIIENFKNELNKHVNEYNLAKESWTKLLKEFGCTSDNQLKSCHRSIEQSPNFRDAMGHAGNSRDRNLIAKYRNFAREQARAAQENHHGLVSARLDRTRIAMLVISIIIAVGIAVTGILSYIKIEPFGSFWFRFSAKMLGSSGMRWLVIFVPLAYVVLASLIVGFKSRYGFIGRGTNIFVIVFASIFILFAGFSSLSGYTMIKPTDSQYANFIETEGYMLSLTEDEETNSLTVTGVYIKDEQVTVAIPDSHGEKAITVIGKGVFKNTNVEKVTLGKNIKRIEENAFENCVNLKSINIPSSVNFIGRYAFRRCSEDAKINFAVTTGWYSTSIADYYQNANPVNSETLKPDKAVSFLDGVNLYLFR